MRKNPRKLHRSGKKLVSKRFVRKAHNHGLKVFVWTGNKLIDIQPYDKIIAKLKRFDIDGIFSDYRTG